MKTVFLFLMWMYTFCAFGQEKQRIAVAATTGNSDIGVRNEIEEALLEAVSNENKYVLIERAKFAQILQEQEFQQSGFVDDEQMVEVGRLAGAEVMLLSSVNLIGSYYKIRYRLVDVSTGTVIHKAAKDASVGNIREVINAISIAALWEKGHIEEKGRICGLEIQKEDAGEFFLSKKEQKRISKEGWRLPTISELKCMCANKEKIGGFNFGEYWSSENKNGHGIGVRFSSCTEVTIQLKASVRYVR